MYSPDPHHAVRVGNMHLHPVRTLESYMREPGSYSMLDLGFALAVPNL